MECFLAGDSRLVLKRWENKIKRRYMCHNDEDHDEKDVGGVDLDHAPQHLPQEEEEEIQSPKSMADYDRPNIRSLKHCGYRHYVNDHGLTSCCRYHKHAICGMVFVISFVEQASIADFVVMVPMKFLQILSEKFPASRYNGYTLTCLR